MITYLAKDTKEGNPQDKQDKVPDGRRDTDGVKDNGDKVDDAGDGGERADDDGIDLRCISKTFFFPVLLTPVMKHRELGSKSTHPFRIHMHILLVAALHVGAIQTTDSQRKRKQDNVDGAKGHVANGEVKATHRGRGSKRLFHV